jgi:hypothetical protein
MYKKIRQSIRNVLCDDEISKNFITFNVGIDVARNGFFKVRFDEQTPSTKINKNGSFHDYGSGEHYGDIISLLYDGYHAFDSLTDTMRWVCQEMNIPWEVNDGQA